MEIEDIIHEEERLGYVIRNLHKAKGRKFPSKDEDFLQIGVLELKKGEWIHPHFHPPRERVINKTQKAVYVVSGKMQFNFYKMGVKVKETIVNAGEIVFLLEGAFGFKALEDETRIIEVKQGPYPGLEADKKKFIPEDFDGK